MGDHVFSIPAGVSMLCETTGPNSGRRGHGTEVQAQVLIKRTPDGTPLAACCHACIPYYLSVYGLDR